jgi:uncharacterized membrane protein
VRENKEKYAQAEKRSQGPQNGESRNYLSRVRTMKILLPPIVALLILAAGIVLHWEHYLPLLPECVASHIDASGKANQWTSKATFVTGARMFFALIPIMVLSLGAISLLAIRTLPPGLVNVPHKEYWLATPECREMLALLTLRFFLWFLFGLMALIYFGAINSLVMTTLHPEMNINQLNLPIFGFGLLFVFAKVGLLFYRLYRPPAGRRSRAAGADYFSE